MVSDLPDSLELIFFGIDLELPSNDFTLFQGDGCERGPSVIMGGGRGGLHNAEVWGQKPYSLQLSGFPPCFSVGWQREGCFGSHSYVS